MVYHFPRLRGRRRHALAFGFAALGLASFASPAVAQDASSQASLGQASIAAQQAQAELQSKIDSADDATREALARLRQTRQQADRLERYNAELEPVVESQSERIARQAQALSQISTTREALPGEMRDMVAQLRTLIEADMPFLKRERLARVDDLASLLANDEASSADKLERIFSAWRTELDYGREMDHWRGPLNGAQSDSAQAQSQFAREVDYLRVGRTGWYYVTPDDHAGGVWRVAEGEWQALTREQIDAVRRGIRISDDQSAPELLELPASVAVESGRDAGGES
ncbi:DUF3450 domain-containing protein [Salinicola aestuarinus]|uniref:DUF3450 domain-containing protein n=1 Tax=Salinicola aestuarinus TaxID=1949082 RepID=UPI001FDA7388|nr:DUF3450 domain-containing protein [Salinicola aestuarinus]